MSEYRKQRALVLAPAPEDDGTVWVPVVEMPWRNDRRDLIQTETEKAS
jgi:hypothetical protein